MKIQTTTKQLQLDQPQVMGILNTTPDSFSDGGQYTTVQRAFLRAKQMIDAGVSIIDIGGESTRPGAPEVSLAEELGRVIPVIQAIRQHYPDIWISIDTSKAEVMRQAVQAGADLINDVRALQEPGALQAAADAQVPVCIMHMKGQPRTMQIAPEYDDILKEVDEFLVERIAACEKAGILRQNIILDPGFGFGKSLEHNYHLLANLEVFHHFGLPLLAGMSRKSMLFKPLGKKPAQCMVASVTSATLAALKGAQILRVHDVEQTVEALTIIQMMQRHKH
ncbi:dihydropteroate synthase [Vibrio metschnikovii]|uniref:Dihydropteroate synthase n=1 Tax=bacterium 19PA01SH03 TaxID=2920705 RepID=A0AAU6SLP0_UNCXX|nr:dihydropteroate synthase [Vibrio metschnikovii]EKO3575926.1 dihydropteroate synthase [Vibrio metschnikovii]EKO3596222.1 dihydropteroate synthase [Vibrio metschnikovii]EKO3600197.1 dihydropteroate synthase [Vibrio metschnikovii]EKO3610379.1 dihydropteroate synthase [Vibrio metschnikovii]EKO3620869.1 dihydropteroate synthase [Vibrio metschnikovii]